MKRNLLSIVIPTILSITVANAAEIYNKNGNKLDLYGKADGLHYFSNDRHTDGDQSYVRFGFKGETQISDQLGGYGQWEYQAQANNDEEQGTSGNKTRLGFAGLKFGDYGSLDYGRNYGVLYDIGAYTDVLPEFGGDTYGTDNFLYQRGNGMLTFRNRNFFDLIQGLDIALQYQGKNGNGGESNNGRGVMNQNHDGFGASATYDIGWGLQGALAYASSKRTRDQNRYNYNPVTKQDIGDKDKNKGVAYGHGDRAEVYMTGLKYDANNVYLAAMYNLSRNATSIGSNNSNAHGYANKAHNIELVGQYLFDFGLQPSIAYLQSRGRNIEHYGTQDIMKYVDLGATYYFNKNMSTYVDYKINLMDKNHFTRSAKINTDDIVALGLVYQF